MNKSYFWGRFFIIWMNGKHCGASAEECVLKSTVRRKIYIFIWQLTMYFGKVQICQMSRLSSPQYWRKSETSDAKDVITIALDILGPVEPLLTTTLAIHWSIDRMTDRQSKGWFPYIWPWDLKFLSKKICTLKRKILSINHW